MKNTIVWNDTLDFYLLLEKLDQAGNGFLVIIDSKNVLLGMVTDGDIRRAILNKQDKVWDIINTDPITASNKMERSDVMKMLHSIHRRQIPVVDENNVLVDIIYLDDEEDHFKNNYVVIMAGGLGSRLGELTKETPKPMLSVGGKPILENIIMGFKESGFNRFILCVSYKSEIIEEYFGDGSNFGVQILYNHEEKKMGTAGALGLIKNDFIDPFFVINGDILSTINFQEFLEFHKKSSALATMCVKKFDYQIPYACISITEDHVIKALIEKPIQTYSINAGMYVLDPSVLDLIPVNDYYDMTTLFEDLMKSDKKTVAYNLNEYWLDIGLKADYTKANNDYKISN